LDDEGEPVGRVGAANLEGEGRVEPADILLVDGPNRALLAGAVVRQLGATSDDPGRTDVVKRRPL
jgi:hypothetical protein